MSWIATVWAWARSRTWALGMSVAMAALSVWSWISWRLRERKVRVEERTRARLAAELERAAAREDTVVVTAADAEAIRAQLDRETHQRILEIQREADQARTSILRRFGSRVIRTSKNEDLKK